MVDINRMAPGSGRRLKEDNTVVNIAEMIESIYEALVTSKDAGVDVSDRAARELGIITAANLDITLSALRNAITGADADARTLKQVQDTISGLQTALQGASSKDLTTLETAIAAVGTILTAIKDTEGIKKIEDDVNTKAVDSEIQQPVEMQSRYQDTVTALNAVSIGATSSSLSTYFPCEGYDTLAVTLQNSAATSSTVKVRWSHDGLADNGEETVLAAGSDQLRAGAPVKVKAKLARLEVTNGDGSARTISAWAFLQA